VTRSRLGPISAGLLVALVCLCSVGTDAAAGSPTTAQAIDGEAPPSKPPEPRRDDPPSLPEREELEPPARARHSAIYWIFGFGTPEGIAGFEGVHRFGDRLELAAGVGTGLAAAASEPHASFGHVLQWSVMPRFRLGDDRKALTLGAGLSGGQYTSAGWCFGCDDGAPSTYPTYYTLWANFEIGGEHWSRGGFALRYYLGFARGAMLQSAPASASSFLAFPYLGIGLGYAF
jgi:hypothetical protein